MDRSRNIYKPVVKTAKAQQKKKKKKENMLSNSGVRLAKVFNFMRRLVISDQVELF